MRGHYAPPRGRACIHTQAQIQACPLPGLLVLGPPPPPGPRPKVGRLPWLGWAGAVGTISPVPPSLKHHVAEPASSTSNLSFIR